MTAALYMTRAKKESEYKLSKVLDRKVDLRAIPRPDISP